MTLICTYFLSRKLISYNNTFNKTWSIKKAKTTYHNIILSIETRNNIYIYAWFCLEEKKDDDDNNNK
jgi:hypothetical protein